MSSDFENVDDLVKCYNNVCKQILDLHAPPPLSIRPRTIRRKPEWYSKLIQDACRVRQRKEERRWRKTRAEDDRLAYIQAQRAVAVTHAKTEHFNDKFASCNIKDRYKTISVLLNTNKKALPSSTSSYTLANEFSEFFVSKVEKIRFEVDSFDTTNVEI